MGSKSLCLFPGKLDRTNLNNYRKMNLNFSDWLYVGFNNVNITYSIDIAILLLLYLPSRIFLCLCVLPPFVYEIGRRGQLKLVVGWNLNCLQFYGIKRALGISLAF